MPPLADPAVRFALSDALLAEAIVAVQRRGGAPVVVGLAGAQGSGKSTTARRIAARLGAVGHVTVVRSIDDFYLTRAERRRLADEVHPLFATRGVPGTHDIALLRQTIAALKRAKDGDATPLPVFDKTIDDRLDPARWPGHAGRVDVVLIEGWCVGARPQPEAALAEPINALERDEDRDGAWRRHVNARLAADYAPLFADFDLRLMLRPPDFAQVEAWRAEQEAGLDRGAGALAPMDGAQLRRFIAHYERLTRWMLEDEPADLIADCDADRAPWRWRLPGR